MERHGELTKLVVMEDWSYSESEANENKCSKADVTWAIDVGDFRTRDTPGDESLHSPKFDVITSSGVPTRWWLNVKFCACDSDRVGLNLCADGEQVKLVKHRAQFTLSFGDDDGVRSDDDDECFATATSELFIDDDNCWGDTCLTTRGRLFGVHLKNSKITVNASLIVLGDEPVEFARYQHVQKLATLFSEQRLGDFTVICEGRHILVYKWALTMGSPVFAAMLSHPDLKEAKENKLLISEFSYGTVFRLLKFLYTGELHLDGNVNLVEMVTAADKYDMYALKLRCADILMYNVTVANACQYFKLATDCRATALKDAAGKLICESRDEAQATEGWKKYIEGDYDLMADLFNIIAPKKAKSPVYLS